MYKYVEHAEIPLQNCLLQVSRVLDKEWSQNSHTCLVLLLWVSVAVYDVL